MEQGREGIEELCLKFSDVVWGDTGLVTGAVKEDLPETGGPVGASQRDAPAVRRPP